MSTISLDEKANGKTIQVQPGDLVIIDLDESPTTGFRWQISELDKQHFQIDKEEYKMDSGAAMGGGGVKTIQLKALHSGSGCIRLENKQPWSGDVYKTVEFNYNG